MAGDSTRTLILMRHAKSDWGDASLSDHDRPLNLRGREASPRMAEWMNQIGILPNLVLCSSAERTKETVAHMIPHWHSEPDIAYSPSLYLASPYQMLATIQQDGCGCQCLMLVAHNPGTSVFVSTLAGQSMDMPTAAIAIFELALEDWSQLRVSSPAQLTHFMRPKAL